MRDVTIQGCDESEWVGVEDWSALSWFFFNCLYYLLFIALYTSTVGQQEEDHRRGEEGRGRASAQVGRRGGGGRPRGQAALDLHLNFPPKSGIRDWLPDCQWLYLIDAWKEHCVYVELVLLLMEKEESVIMISGRGRTASRVTVWISNAAFCQLDKLTSSKANNLGDKVQGSLLTTVYFTREDYSYDTCLLPYWFRFDFCYIPYDIFMCLVWIYTSSLVDKYSLYLFVARTRADLWFLKFCIIYANRQI